MLTQGKYRDYGRLVEQADTHSGLPRRHYLWFTVLALLLVLVLSAGFSVYADPYGIYRYGRSDVSHLSRIDQLFFHRLSKPYQIRQRAPEAVVLGTSRSARIPPAHAAWDGLRTYNASIPGLTRIEIFDYFVHINTVQPQQALLLGLDFESFLGRGISSHKGFERSRLLSEKRSALSPVILSRLAVDAYQTLVTVSALADGVMALSGNAVGLRRFYPDGTWQTLHSEHNGRLGFSMVGYAFKRTRGIAAAGAQVEYGRLRDLLAYCYENNIDTRVLLTPVHLYQLSIVFDSGFKPLWRDWHAGVVAINNELAMAHDRDPFPVWGFNQAPGIVDEVVQPAALARDSVYKDGVHFRASFGQQIVDEIYEQGPADVGWALTTANVESYLDSVESLVEGYAPVMAEFEARRTERRRNRVARESD